MLFRRSEFDISVQIMSSYLSAYVQIALRLVRESDSILSSDSFCLNASRIAPSSAREFEAVRTDNMGRELLRGCEGRLFYGRSKITIHDLPC